ncbi:MAG: glycosyltransferase family 2 protein [Candidatus Binatia bacterium]
MPAFEAAGRVLQERVRLAAGPPTLRGAGALARRGARRVAVDRTVSARGPLPPCDFIACNDHAELSKFGDAKTLTMLRSDSGVPDTAHGGLAARSAASVSVVLPAYNEAATIGEVVRGARRATPNLSEVLVVDDGNSGDDTAAVATAAGATVIRHPRNRGKGEALRGCRAATGGILLFLDADRQDDVEEIPLLLDALRPTSPWRSARLAGRLLDGSITTLNRFGNRMLTGVFNGLYGSAISDTQAGFRAVRRDSIDAPTCAPAPTRSRPRCSSTCCGAAVASSRCR